MGTQSTRMRAFFAASYLLLFALGSGSCGGASSAASVKTQGARERPSAEEREPSSDEVAAPEREEAPKVGACDDSTCSPCGAGICPNGWYCDESAAFGPACGWLTECAEKPSCRCLSKKLGASCQCSEQGGGLHVTCK